MQNLFRHRFLFYLVLTFFFFLLPQEVEANPKCLFHLLSDWSKGSKEQPFDYARFNPDKTTDPISAFGEGTWKAFREGEHFLNSIPIGKFKLSLGLIQKLHKKTYVDYFSRSFGRGKVFVSAILQMNFSDVYDFKGQFKRSNSFGITWKAISESQFQELRSNKTVKFIEMPWPLSRKDQRMGIIVYSAPQDVERKLRDLVGWVNAELGHRDPIELAATFHKRFIEIHPFPDGNGRVGRLIMDRLLLEYGIPPPVIREQDSDLFSSEQQWVRIVEDSINQTIEDRARFLERKHGSVPEEIIQYNGESFSFAPETKLLHDRFGQPYVLIGNKLTPITERTYQFLNTAMSFPSSEWLKAKERTADARFVGSKSEQIVPVPYDTIRKASEDNKIKIPRTLQLQLEKSPLFRTPKNLYDALKLGPQDKRTQFEQAADVVDIPATQVLAQYQKFKVELAEFRKALEQIDPKLVDKLNEREKVAQEMVGRYFQEFGEKWNSLSNSDRQLLLNNPVNEVFFSYLKYTPFANQVLGVKPPEDLDKNIYLFVERNSLSGKIGIRSDQNLRQLFEYIPFRDSLIKGISAIAKNETPNGYTGILNRIRGVLESPFKYRSAEIPFQRKYVEFYIHHIDSTFSNYISLSSNVDLYRKALTDGTPRYAVNSKDVSLFIVKVPRDSLSWNSFTEYSHVYEFLQPGSIPVSQIMEVKQLKNSVNPEESTLLSESAQQFYNKFLHDRFFMPILPDPTMPAVIPPPADEPRSTKGFIFPFPK